MTTKKSLFLLASGIATLGLAACNTFDPTLGAAPFRCGTESPRCPSNYECVTYSPADEVCERIGGDPVNRADGGTGGPDGGGDFSCANDSEIEPNESLSDPTLTSIPQVQNSVRLVGLSICPSTDQDFFRFDIETNATDAVVEISYSPNGGLLSLDLLNNTGASISSGTPVSGATNLIRAAVPNLPTGTYFAHVRASAEGIRNNYSIEIITNP